MFLGKIKLEHFPLVAFCWFGKCVLNLIKRRKKLVLKALFERSFCCSRKDSVVGVDEEETKEENGEEEFLGRHFLLRLRRVTWRLVSSLILLCLLFVLTLLQCRISCLYLFVVVDGRPAALQIPISIDPARGVWLLMRPLLAYVSRDQHAVEHLIKRWRELSAARRTTNTTTTERRRLRFWAADELSSKLILACEMTVANLSVINNPNLCCVTRRKCSFFFFSVLVKL